ncbi:MAG: hypothetical protein JW969_12520 [Spirochaetales bacterium]|nr:hypothetical protein [Spirochaetales bacterium]
MKNNKQKETEMLPEYDFSKGVRGKYHKAYKEGTNIVILEPEIMKEFPDSKSVNKGLRELMRLRDRRHREKIKKIVNTKQRKSSVNRRSKKKIQRSKVGK